MVSKGPSSVLLLTAVVFVVMLVCKTASALCAEGAFAEIRAAGIGPLMAAFGAGCEARKGKRRQNDGKDSFFQDSFLRYL